jgi:hypothetical protein
LGNPDVNTRALLNSILAISNSEGPIVLVRILKRGGGGRERKKQEENK